MDRGHEEGKDLVFLIKSKKINSNQNKIKKEREISKLIAQDSAIWA